MPDFSAKSPGDKSPARDAAWITAVSASAAAFHGRAALGSSKGSKPAHSVDRSSVKIKNLTGDDLVRGHYVQLGEFELDAKDPRKIWFEGNLYDEAESGRIAIVTNAVKEDKRVDAVLIGIAVARVDVTSTSHRFAAPADGEFLLVSADSGNIEILDVVTGTGEQDCAVLLSASGGTSTSVIRVILWGNPGPLTKDDAEFKFLPLETPALRMTWDPESGDDGEWVPVEDDDDGVISVTMPGRAELQIPTGKGRHALCMNDEGEWPVVFWVDCEDIDFTPP